MLHPDTAFSIAQNNYKVHIEEIDAGRNRPLATDSTARIEYDTAFVLRRFISHLDSAARNDNIIDIILDLLSDGSRIKFEFEEAVRHNQDPGISIVLEHAWLRLKEDHYAISLEKLEHSLDRRGQK